MANTPSHSRPTVGILYGFAEGRLTSRILRKELKQAGYDYANPNLADIIISHSGGYLVMPETFRAKLIIYVDPNTWGEQSLFTSLKQKLRYDYNLRKSQKQMITWLLQGLRNDIYVLKVLHTWKLARGYRAKPLPPATDAHCAVIRNRHDNYCTTPGLLNWSTIQTYLSCEGGHDDIWNNPHKYVEILDRLYE